MLVIQNNTLNIKDKAKQLQILQVKVNHVHLLICVHFGKNFCNLIYKIHFPICTTETWIVFLTRQPVIFHKNKLKIDSYWFGYKNIY